MNKAHGNLHFYWEGSVLVVEPSGTINVETAQESSAGFYTMLAEHPRQKWCRLEHFADTEMLATPEAIEEMRLSLQVSKDAGCIAVGSVGGNIVMRDIFKRSVQALALPYQEFDSLSSALTALTRRIADHQQIF